MVTMRRRWLSRRDDDLYRPDVCNVGAVWSPRSDVIPWRSPVV